MNILCAAMLRAAGYIPENVQACRDYSAGRISQSELWRILNNNILWNMREEIFSAEKKKKRPRQDDLVSVDDSQHGRILYVTYSEGYVEEVCVEFYDGSTEDFDSGYFTQYTTKGGPTRWLVFTDFYGDIP